MHLGLLSIRGNTWFKTDKTLLETTSPLWLNINI